MKKVVLGFVVVIAACAGLGPYFVGKNLRTTIEAMVSDLNSVPGYTATWAHYDRSWKQSDAVVVVTYEDVSIMEASAEQLDIPMQLNIEHGPFLFGNGFKLGWFDLRTQLTVEADALIREKLNVENEDPFYLFEAEMDLLRKVEIKDRSLAFTFQEDGNTASVSEYRGMGTLSASQVLEYSMALPSVDGELDGDTFELAGGTLDFSSDLSRAVELGFSPGKAKLVVPRFAVPAQSILLESLRLDSVIALDDAEAFINLSFDFNMSRLVFEDQYIEHPVAQVRYNQISVEFMRGYQDALEHHSNASSDQQMMQALTDLVYDELLAESPSFSIDNLSFTHSEGELNAHFKVIVDGETLVAADLDSSNPMALIPFVNVDSQITVAKTFAEFVAKQYMRQQVEQQATMMGEQVAEDDVVLMVNQQAPEMLQMLEMQNVFVNNDDNYVTTIKLDKGQASLNGQPMPLPF